MTYTNIKSLPEGTYFTEVGYSEYYPWVEVKRTAKTVTLAKVMVARDPDWKPEITPGGFLGHCSNQSDQTWLFYKVNPDHTTTIRMTKRGWARGGVRFVEGWAVEFYEWNF